MGGRVDQPAAPARSTRRLPAHRSPCSRAGGSSAAPNRLQPVGRQPLEAGDGAVRQGAGVAGQAGEGQQPLGGVELGPRRRRARWAGRGCRWCGGPPARTRAGAAGGGGPAPAELGLGARARAAPSSIHSSTRNGGASASPSATASTSGTAHGPGLAQPPQPGRLGGEEPGRRARVGLGEHPSTVVELEAVRLGHVAASHDPRRRTGARARRRRPGAARPWPEARSESARRASGVGTPVPTTLLWFRRDLRLSDHPALSRRPRPRGRGLGGAGLLPRRSAVGAGR